MTAHLDQLASLAASLPPGAVLAHVVTEMVWERSTQRPMIRVQVPRTWAKIGDEPWRLAFSVEMTGTAGVGSASLTIEAAALYCGYHRVTRRVVTDSVVWEQDYGLRGRHEAMGVVG